MLKKLEEPEGKIDGNNVKMITSTISKRRTLNFTGKDIADYFVRCIICRKPYNLKREKANRKQF